MKIRIAVFCVCNLLAGWALFSGSAYAQTMAYRQTNLASSVPGSANNTSASLTNPWAIAFLPGQSFFIADGGSGTISAQNALGSQAGTIGIPSASGVSAPTGLAADGTGVFGTAGASFQYVVATQGGAILGFSAPKGELPAQATLVRDDSSSGAVYTGVALVHPNCCAPFVAVANFSAGSVQEFTDAFAPQSKPASFQDPNLPAGYAPYGLAVIGNQIYVTYALQNAAKNGPVAGAGNGVVDVYDLQGNFARRFAMGGSLNAPWGVALASSNFGPFSGAILIGNFGDGTISAFDASSGNFLGQLRDGDGNLLVNAGVRGLAFRADGVADVNTLFFTADGGNNQGGLLGAITAGLTSVTRASAAAGNKSAALTVTVAAGPGNSGTPTGSVAVSDRGLVQGSAVVADGMATVSVPAAAVRGHSLNVQYSGDANFTPSSTSMMMPNPAAAAADFSLAASPTSVTVSAGQSAPVTVTVTPSNGFNSNVTLSCSSVPGVSCTFGSSTLSTASGTASTNMNISVAMGTPRYGYKMALHGGVGPGGLFGALGLLGLIVARSRSFKRARLAVLGSSTALVVFALALTVGGCGYGSSYSAPQNSAPAGMTITAQSGSLTHTTTVNVTVQ